MPPANQSTIPTPHAAGNLPSVATGNQGHVSHSEKGWPVKLSLSAFKLDSSAPLNRTHAIQLIYTFNSISFGMERSLALELAEFLPKAVEQSPISKVKLPTEHEFYKRLRGIECSQKDLYYPYWVFLAAHWGAGHPSLDPIRKDMSKLWEVEFRTTTITYPGDMPVERQKAHFHGRLFDSSPLGEIQRRAQGFKAAIEGDGKPSVIEAVTDYAPTLLNKAVLAGDGNSLHRMLRDTQEQLQKTQGQLRETQKRLQDTAGELQETRKKHKNDIERSSKDLAATNLRVDKVMDTCALVLGILTAPEGEKRKDRSEEEDA